MHDAHFIDSYGLGQRLAAVSGLSVSTEVPIMTCFGVEFFVLGF